MAGKRRPYHLQSWHGAWVLIKSYGTERRAVREAAVIDDSANRCPNGCSHYRVVHKPTATVIWPKPE